MTLVSTGSKQTAYIWTQHNTGRGNPGERAGYSAAIVEAQGEEALRASGINCGIVIILTQGGLSLGGIVIASLFCLVLGFFLDTGYV